VKKRQRERGERERRQRRERREREEREEREREEREERGEREHTHHPLPFTQSLAHIPAQFFLACNSHVVAHIHLRVP
jgi:hypothetical protein